MIVSTALENWTVAVAPAQGALTALVTFRAGPGIWAPNKPTPQFASRRL